MKVEALAGTLSESKVLKWKWFLSEFLNNHKIMARRKTPLWVEEIASAPMVPCPITMPKNYTGQEYQPLGDREMGQLTNKRLVH
jgi:hypothetical protein